MCIRGKARNLTLFLIVSFLAFAGIAHGALLEQWMAAYSGPGANQDWAYGMKMDTDGNVYTTGYVFDADNDYAIATVKYGPDGTQLWADEYKLGVGNYCYPNSMTLSPGGAPIVVGYCYDTSNDGIILVYDASGTIQWSDQYDGDDGGEDVFYTVTTDDSGNVYAVGYEETSGAGTNYLTVKYDSSGTQLWSNNNNGTGNGTDVAYSVAVDDSGNVYLTGYQSTTTNTVAAVVKLNSSGNFQWRRYLSGSGTGNNFGGTIAVAQGGDIYTTSMKVNSTKADSYDIALDWMPPDNSTVDGFSWDGPENSQDLLPNHASNWYIFGPDNRSFIMDDAGNTYIIGTTIKAATGYDSVLLKCDSSGTLQWAEIWDSGEAGTEFAGEVIFDSAGHILVAGITLNVTSFNYDGYLLIYDSAGNLLDTVIYDGPGSNDDLFADMALDADDNPVFAGLVYSGATTGFDMLTIKYCRGCLISDECYPDGAANPSNECEACDVATDQTDWSLNDGAPCDDGIFCNGEDSCQSGTCSLHDGDPCTDNGLWCDGTESCDEDNDECDSSGDPCDPVTEVCNEDTDTCDEAGDDDDNDDNDDNGGGGDDDDDGGCCG